MPLLGVVAAPRRWHGRHRQLVAGNHILLFVPQALVGKRKRLCVAAANCAPQGASEREVGWLRARADDRVDTGDKETQVPMPTDVRVTFETAQNANLEPRSVCGVLRC